MLEDGIESVVSLERPAPGRRAFARGPAQDAQYNRETVLCYRRVDCDSNRAFMQRCDSAQHPTRTMEALMNNGAAT